MREYNNDVPPRRSDAAVSPRYHRQLQALRRSDALTLADVSPRRLEASDVARQLEASLFLVGGGGPTLRQSDLFSKELC